MVRTRSTTKSRRILIASSLYLPRVDVKAAASAPPYEEGVEAPIRQIAFDDAARVSISPIDQET